MKITLFIDSRGQVVRTVTEAWSEDSDTRASTVPSPPMLILKDDQKRLFAKSKAQQKPQADEHSSGWTKYNKPTQ